MVVAVAFVALPACAADASEDAPSAAPGEPSEEAPPLDGANDDARPPVLAHAASSRIQNFEHIAEMYSVGTSWLAQNVTVPARPPANGGIWSLDQTLSNLDGSVVMENSLVWLSDRYLVRSTYRWPGNVKQVVHAIDPMPGDSLWFGMSASACRKPRAEDCAWDMAVRNRRSAKTGSMKIRSASRFDAFQVFYQSAFLTSCWQLAPASTIGFTGTNINFQSLAESAFILEEDVHICGSENASGARFFSTSWT